MSERHVHEPFIVEPAHIEYRAVWVPPSYGCEGCDAALYVLPTPEEADEYDRVLQSQWDERREVSR